MDYIVVYDPPTKKRQTVDLFSVGYIQNCCQRQIYFLDIIFKQVHPTRLGFKKKKKKIAVHPSHHITAFCCSKFVVS